MKTLKKIILATLCLPLLVAAKEKDDHSSHAQGQDTEQLDHHKKDAEKDHKDHFDGDDHEDKENGKEAESNPQVGEGKGIVAASENLGFKLSPQAEKNFEIKKVTISNLKSIGIPKAAIVTSAAEVNIYRVREGYYKRIDFIKANQSGDTIFIRSPDLKLSDEIVVSGMSFLRIAELAAFDGAPAGHSH